MTAQTKTAAGSKIETGTWWFMRLSGVLIIPLVFGHLAIMHVINSVADINYEWVVNERWSLLPWRLYDAALLWLAGLHGYRGVQYVINDYVHGAALNRILRALSVVVLLVVLAAGTIALIGTPFSTN
ncbi:MAG: hypothetical protein Kow00124_01890 [Anaerolineae bacterium]